MENLKPGALSPFNVVVDYQRYISSLAWADHQAPTTTVNEAGTRVTYKDVTLDVEKWILGLRKGLDDLKLDLKECSGGQLLQVTLSEDIPDDMTESLRGYSWLNNGVFTRPHALMEVMMKDPQTEICKKGREGLEWNHPAMHKLMLKLSGLQFPLAILLNALPGQPARISELMDSKIRNSTRGRTLFRAHNNDWLMTRRVKHENQIRRETFIPKKVPPELQEILDYYLLIIRPLEIDLARQLWGDKAAVLYHEYMFVYMGKRMEEEQFSQALKKFSRKYFGCEVGPRAYRQLVVAIARVYLGSEYEIYEDDQEKEGDALAEQAGHSASTRRLHYAAEHGHLVGMTSEVLLRYGHISEAWWQLTRFYPGKSPLLPLQHRRQIRQDAANTSTAFGPQPQPGVPAPAAPNLAALTETLTATLKASIAQMKIELQAGIQAAVAAGCQEMLSRQQPALAPTPLFNQEMKDFLKDTITSAVADAMKDHGGPVQDQRGNAMDEDSIEDLYQPWPMEEENAQGEQHLMIARDTANSAFKPLPPITYLALMLSLPLWPTTLPDAPRKQTACKQPWNVFRQSIPITLTSTSGLLNSEKSLFGHWLERKALSVSYQLVGGKAWPSWYHPS
jgi:hypothetical protein